MVKEQFYVKGIDVRKSQKTGDEFYVVVTDKGDLSCFEQDIMKKLDPCMRKTIEVEVVAAGKYKNIRDFYNVVENAQAKEEAKDQEKGGDFNGNLSEKAKTISVLTSYAKDIFVSEGYTGTIEGAADKVLLAYKLISANI